MQLLDMHTPAAYVGCIRVNQEFYELRVKRQPDRQECARILFLFYRAMSAVTSPNLTLADRIHRRTCTCPEVISNLHDASVPLRISCINTYPREQKIPSGHRKATANSGFCETVYMNTSSDNLNLPNRIALPTALCLEATQLVTQTTRDFDYSRN